MRPVRSTVGAGAAGLVLLLAGFAAPAAASASSLRLPSFPSPRLVPASQLPDGLGPAVAHAAQRPAAAPAAQGQQTELQATDGVYGDGLGYAVSLNDLGNVAVAGAPGRDGQEGVAYVFVREGGTWVQQAELTPSDGAPGDEFGNAVAVNALGTVAIVGAFNHNGSDGAAYVFVRQDGNWVQQAELQPPDAGGIDWFGNSVAIDALGDEVLVGAPNHNAAEGAAYVFVRQGAQWVQQAELQPSDGASGDGFGWSVALDAPGNEAVIGSPEHNNFDGAAYVFVRQGRGWVQQQELAASDGAPGDLLGFSVAVDALGDEALAGAIGHNGVIGAAYVFARQGSGWVQQAELTPSDGVPGDGFGVSVALNGFGNEALVGAYAQNNAEGAAYLYARRGAAWSQEQELTPADGAPDDLFGYSVSLNALGDEALIGAPLHNTTGAAYVFEGL